MRAIRRGATLVTVALKELKDFFRDPRSLIISLLLPVLLFPILFLVLTREKPAGDADQFLFRVARTGIAEEVSPSFDRLVRRILIDQRLELENEDPSSAGNAPEPRELLLEGDYDLVLAGTDDGSDNFVVVYNNADAESSAALGYLMRLSAEREALGEKSASEMQEPVLPTESLYPPADAAGRMLLALVLPFMIFIFGATCPLPVAADLSAGEKERGSLEPLLSTAASRKDIVFGKLTAAFTVGSFSVAAYFAGVGISALINPTILGEEQMTFALRLPQFLLLLVLTLQITAVFAALEFTAGLLARSVREAQLMGMPLLIIAMGAVYTALNADLQAVPLFYAHLPLVNIALVIREAALDRIHPIHTLSAVIWGLIYLAAAAAAAVKMFQKESTLFRQ
jgi:sodium transport system permease protein